MLHLDSARSPLDFDIESKTFRHLESTGTLEDPMDRLRLLCLSRGDTGFMVLGRMLRHMDKHGTRMLNQKEFTLGLRKTGMEITDEEAKDMFKQFDITNSGRISIDDFVVAMRPPMSEYRKRIIEKAFNKIDKTGNGEITINELKNIYNIQYHPLYRPGEESEDAVFKRFLANFAEGAPKHGHVTSEEFLNYYAAICATFDNDGHFDLMMCQCYNI